MEKIKLALVDLALSIIKGLKTFMFFILPALLIAALSSSEFRSLINNQPELAIYSPLINVVVIVLVDIYKNASTKKKK